MWAFSKLGCEDGALFAAINRRILATLPGFSVQNLANIVRAVPSRARQQEYCSFDVLKKVSPL